MDNLRVYMGTDFIWLNIVDWVRLGVLQGNRGTAWGSSGEDWGPSAVGLRLIPGQATRSYMPKLTVWKLQDPNEGRRSRMPPRPSADKQVNCSPYKKKQKGTEKKYKHKKADHFLGESSFNWEIFLSTHSHEGGASDKEPTSQCRRHKRHRFNLWVGEIPWRRKWQPTPVFLPGKSYGQRSLVGYSPWGHKRVGHD